MHDGHQGAGLTLYPRCSEPTKPRSTDAGRGLASDWVSQVQGTAPLDDDRVVEELVAPVQLREVAAPPNALCATL